MTKYFIPEGVGAVAQSVAGFVRAHAASLRVQPDPLFVYTDQANRARKVGLVSGGGSGHEPMHAGFVGAGMLDAAVPGEVFASPHNRQVFEASRQVAKSEGVLHIVKNYTGDKINFGIAAERLRAENIDVARVLVDDDLATESDATDTGRRGTGATVIVEKILGGAADQGLGLQDLVELGERVSARSRSVAVASQALTSVHTGEPVFTLPENNVEYGVGIHGERAVSSIQRPSNNDLIDRMVDDVLGALSPAQGSDVLVFVNGLGSVTELELYAIYGRIAQQIGDQGVRLAANLVGTYVSALDMRGFSLTITELEPSWLDYWHAPVSAPGFAQPSVVAQQEEGA